jgi:DNA primase
MAHIPRDIVDAVRDRTDIVEVVSRHVRLDRRGGSWVGLCPFHQEKSPSFNVIPNKAMYYCFGCQAAGDVFRFVMQMENLNFFEAVQQLAGPAGVTIETRQLTDEERRAFKARATLYDIQEEAAQWFEAQLWTSADGAPARAYLERRGMAEAFARKARLGWAPGGWTKLMEHLERKGYPARLVLESGLAKPRERGDGAYDAFRERLMVPIRDERSRVIAFGGRILQGDGPKYINSSETQLYQKSKVLYGLDLAQNAIRARQRVLLVEGYFDVLSLQQAGFMEAIATCGTALSDEHADRLTKLTRDITFLSDSDAAGEAAAERIEEKYLLMLVRRGVSGWRLTLPDAKDPDELIRERGPEAFEQAMRSRVSLLYWVVQRKLKRFGYSAEGKKKMLEDSAELLAELPPIARVEYAGYARLPEELVHEAARRAHRPAPPPPSAGPPDWRPPRDLVHLVWLLVHRYGEVGDLMHQADPGLLDPQVRPLVARLLTGEPAVRILDDLPDGGIRRLLAATVARPQLYEPDQAASALVDLLVRLARPEHDARVAALRDQATAALKTARFAEARVFNDELKQRLQAWREIETAGRTERPEVVVAHLSRLPPSTRSEQAT